jgi:hypothetical protein
MKNPFNPDHHAVDIFPEIHEALRQLSTHEKQVINNAGALSDEHQKVIAAMDAILSACPNCECDVCGSIICPKGDEMHFHHDGCPSC